MCTSSKSHSRPSNPLGYNMEDKDNQNSCRGSVLLELAASDDLSGFRTEIEVKGLGVDEGSFWYGRRIGSKKMGFEYRTPLMIAALYGSTNVLKYIINTGKVDVNKACGSDGVTALHCAVASGSSSVFRIVNLLLGASADANRVNGSGNQASDLINSTFKSPSDPRRKHLELLLKGIYTLEEGDRAVDQVEEKQNVAAAQLTKDGSEKKEYPVDVSLPDINSGIYITDEFRMYSFKVKPCSRAYSHDWTECPFVHPGENARRRDPRKYPYTCVPCPEFRKGTCQKGDACEYAHGVFESWLHPAQYRTRLCKDETGCSRKVCFFAHKPEELRPVCASTGSAMPSPKSPAASMLDMTALSPLHLSSTLPMPTTSTPPMSPLAASSSPKTGNLWQNKMNLTPPALQLPGSRLKTALSARDLDLQMELLRVESQVSHQKQQQLMDEISSLSSPHRWNRELKPANLDDVFSSFSPPTYSQLQELSRPGTPTQLQSPAGLRLQQNTNQYQTNYSMNLTASPARSTSSSYGFDSSGAVAAAVMNSRSAAFAKRSQSFIDRGAMSPGRATPGNSANMMSSKLPDWSSPNGKLDWGIQADDLNKFKKSASFNFRGKSTARSHMTQPNIDEPDVSWVHSLVKDVSPVEERLFSGQQRQYNIGKGSPPRTQSPWVEQLYIEQEPMVA